MKEIKKKDYKAALEPMDTLCIVTTGGTIDKIYFDDKSDYQIGEPQIGGILRELGVAFQFTVIPIIRKDSLHITQEDRELIRATIAAQPAKHVLVTHAVDRRGGVGLRDGVDHVVGANDERDVGIAEFRVDVVHAGNHCRRNDFRRGPSGDGGRADDHVDPLEVFAQPALLLGPLVIGQRPRIPALAYRTDSQVEEFPPQRLDLLARFRTDIEALHLRTEPARGGNGLQAGHARAHHQHP